jgi:hypothetical protein
MFLGKLNILPTSVAPITAMHTNHNIVAQRNNSPHLPMLKHVHETFWQFLASGGGNWMWDYILNKDTEPLWIVNALLNGTAILSIDGLYHRNKAPQASGAGWIIACRCTGRMLQGSFYELSIDASAYWGELLGLVALHTLLHRIFAYYKLCLASGKLVCDSKLALNKSSRKGCRIRTGMAQADLFCALRTIHQGMVGTTLVYEWVKSYQDKRLPWHQLLLEAQLNKTCNNLVNNVVTRALANTDTTQENTFLLPFEQLAIICDGAKITSRVAPVIRFHLGRVDAKKFYTRTIWRVAGSNKGGLRWSKTKFESVDWKALEHAIRNKPEDFQLWLSKQAIGVCATQKNTTHIQDIHDNKYPNFRCRREDRIAPT